MSANVADALGRIVDPVARWRERRRATRLLRFLLSESQVVYRYPTLRRATDWMGMAIVHMGDWARLGAGVLI